MKNSRLFYFSALALFLMLSSCLKDVDSDLEKQIRTDDMIIQTFLSKNKVEAEKLASGVYMKPLRENKQGKKVQEGHVANVLYFVRILETDRIIEEYTDTLRPLQFSHTANALVPAGLNYGLAQMREGERYRFFIPSYQAFGNYGHKGLFEANSNLIIDMDVLKLQTEEEVYHVELDSIRSYVRHHELSGDVQSNGLFYSKQKEGQGQTAADGSRVTFHFTRKYLDGTVLETTKGKNPVQVAFQEKKLVKGLEQGIKLMKKGEEAIIIIPSKLAFGKSLQVIPQKVRENWVEEDKMDQKTLPFTPIIYELELIEIY